MGVIDKDGYIYLRGRSKCMILGPSGQNIYPEELEAVINNVTYVVDSLVIEEDGGRPFFAAILYHRRRSIEPRRVRYVLQTRHIYCLPHPLKLQN